MFYADYLRRLLVLVETTNDANKESITKTGEIYTNDIPVIYEDELVGFIRDEIGGEYNFVPVTEDERAWWESRPWSPKKPEAKPNRPARVICHQCNADQAGDRTFCRQCGVHLHLNSEGEPDVR